MALTLALLGTSSDPPTKGHQCLLEGLLARFDKVATWASDNPMKMKTVRKAPKYCTEKSGWWIINKVSKKT